MRFLPLALWALATGLGGIWLATAAFRLEKRALLPVGLALGWALQNLLASLLGFILPFSAAAGLGAGLTAATGLGAVLALRRDLPPLRRLLPPFSPAGLFALGALALLAFGMGRGTAIFDDFAHLPDVGVMGAGHYPLQFPFDPQVPYAYHSFLLITAAETSALARLPAWTALDLARGLSAALALVLAYAWGSRVTRHRLGGLFTALSLAFASGARWLLLLLPAGVLHWLSAGVTMLGSGAGSGPDLPTALGSPWAVEGAGPIPFPFAFVNGLMQPGVLGQYSATGLLEPAFLLALLLVFPRRRGWLGNLGAALFFSALPQLGEAGPLLGLGGLGLAGISAWLQTPARGRQTPAQGRQTPARGRQTPARGRQALLRSWLGWAAVALGGLGLGLLPGGALTAALAGLAGLGTGGDYHSMGFRLVFPPTLVSSHLGVLLLFNPAQLLLALAEAGPLLLLLPRLLRGGWKAARAERWFAAGLAWEAGLSLLMLLVQYSGSEGVRNTQRLYRFMPILALFAVPLLWQWLGAARQRGTGSGAARLVAAGWLAAIAGGLGLFLIQLPALQRPQYSSFISELDARMLRSHWNRLEREALVFDPVAWRAPTVLGLYTRSHLTYYRARPDWEALVQAPAPQAIRAAGFRYAFWDNARFEALPEGLRAEWAACGEVVDELVDGEAWRRLYDLRTCAD